VDELQTQVTFILQNWQSLEVKLFEHILISLISLGCALLIAVPTGAIMRHVPILRKPLLQSANILQTIPSLALLAFLVPFIGIGIKPTIIALVAYALLPIIQNTYVGLTEIPQGIVDSAKSLGLSKCKVLCGIELPLAMPTILAGVRTATAMIIGITTVASLIGAGGLGDFITQGLALNDTQFILLGAIPATILAILADYTMSHIGDILFDYTSKTAKASWGPKFIIGIFALIVGYLFGKALYLNYLYEEENTIKVASKNFAEQMILGEIIAQLLERETNLKIIRKSNLGDTAFIHEAIQKGEVDLYPEYSGTVYLNILKYKKKLSAKKTYTIVQKAYEEQFGLVWLAPLGFLNSNALVVRKSFADTRNLRNISDLNRYYGKLSIGAAPEFVKRADALPGLIRTYGVKFRKVQSIAPDLVFKSLISGDVDVIMAYTTDGKVEKNNLIILKDDLKLFPPYQAGIIIRKKILKRHPHLKKILSKLSGKITEEKVRTMNLKVESGKSTPKEVAQEFLESIPS